MGSLFLVRHATTEASQAGVNLGNRSDPPLTADGRRLAERTGDAIRAELAALAGSEIRLVSSPAQRCRETLAAIARRLGDRDATGGQPEVELEPGLWEIDYGGWEGLTHAESHQRDPELRARWEADPYHTATPDGESGADVERRAAAVLDSLAAWLAEDRARAAVVVAHNHVVRVRLAALLGLPMADYRRRVVADPGAYSLVTHGSDHATVRRVNVLPLD